MKRRYRIVYYNECMECTFNDYKNKKSWCSLVSKRLEKKFSRPIPIDDEVKFPDFCPLIVDLENAPEEMFVYHNYYKDGTGGTGWATRQIADMNVADRALESVHERISCQRVKIEPGRFDE